jgi:hypothetical protein
MYQQPGGTDQGEGPASDAGSAGPTDEPGGSPSGDDDVVDGEVKNV